MLNIQTKCIILSRDVIWLTKIYGEYVSRELSIKEISHILQHEDDYYNWGNLKMDPVKTKTNTENIKIKNVRTNQYYGGGEYVQKTTDAVYFIKQEH